MLDRTTLRHTRESLAAGRRQSVMFGGLRGLTLTEDGGHLDVAAVQLGPKGQKIVRVRSTGHHVDLAEDGQAVLLLPRLGRLDSQLASRDYRVQTGEALLFGSNERLTQVNSPFDAMALTLPQAELAQALQGIARLPDAVLMPSHAAGLRRLFQILSDIHALAFAPVARIPPEARVAGLQVMVQDALLDMVMARLLDDGTERQPRSALHRVLQAEEVMRAHMAEPISMADVARLLGISLRSLQMAFRDVRQMGPRDALNLIRLDATRRLLLQARPGDTVTGIALDCGVSHVSRFASVYRLAYGEYPAETLAEALRRSS